MLSDEEKKAIESLIEIREFANLSSYKDVRINQLNAIDIILNLIEKQSKEIEILNKNMNLLREQNISYKQSIHGLKEINKKGKDKIEELKEKNKEYENMIINHKKQLKQSGIYGYDYDLKILKE